MHVGGRQQSGPSGLTLVDPIQDSLLPRDEPSESQRSMDTERCIRSTVACSMPLTTSALLFLVLAMLSPAGLSSNSCQGPTIKCGWSTVRKEGTDVPYPAGSGFYVNASLVVSIGLFESCYDGDSTTPFRLPSSPPQQGPPLPLSSQGKFGESSWSVSIVLRQLSVRVFGATASRAAVVAAAGGAAPSSSVVASGSGAGRSLSTEAMVPVNICGGVNAPTFGPAVDHIDNFLELVQVTKTLVILGTILTAASLILSLAVAFLVPSKAGPLGAVVSSSLLGTLHTCIALSTLFALPFILCSFIVWSSANDMLETILPWGNAGEWELGSCYYATIASFTLLLPVAVTNLVLKLYAIILRRNLE